MTRTPASSVDQPVDSAGIGQPLPKPFARFLHEPPDCVERCISVEPDPSIPGLHRFIVIPSPRSAHARSPARHIYLGVAAEARLAAMAAVGEFVERECALAFDPGKCPRGRAADVQPPHLAAELGHWNLYSPQQYTDPGFPFAPLTSETSVRWANGRTGDGNAASLPADAVHLRAPVDRLRPPTSSGLCAHTDPESCRRGALDELLERDAVMNAWLTKDGWTRLAIEHDLHQQLSPFMRADRRYEFFKVESRRMIPVIVCLSRRSSDTRTESRVVRPSVVGSSACAANVFGACLHALAEQAQAWWALEAMGEGMVADAPLEHRAVASRLDHLRWWAACPDANKALAWLDNAPVRSIDAHESLRIHSPRIASFDNEVAWVELTRDPFASMGFHVARAVAPGLTPLYFGEHLRPLNAARIRTRTTTDGELNRLPHPFV